MLGKNKAKPIIKYIFLFLTEIEKRSRYFDLFLTNDNQLCCVSLSNSLLQKRCYKVQILFSNSPENVTLAYYCYISDKTRCEWSRHCLLLQKYINVKFFFVENFWNQLRLRREKIKLRVDGRRTHVGNHRHHILKTTKSQSDIQWMSDISI